MTADSSPRPGSAVVVTRAAEKRESGGGSHLGQTAAFVVLADPGAGPGCRVL